MFQNLSNGVLGAQFGVCFPFQPKLWTFITPKVKVHLEVIGFLPLHSPSFMKVCFTLNTLFWPHGPLHATLSHEPNVRVVTQIAFPFWKLKFLNLGVKVWKAISCPNQMIINDWKPFLKIVTNWVPIFKTIIKKKVMSIQKFKT